MLKFFIIFFAIQGILFTLELWGPVREAVIDPFTIQLAALSAWIIGIFDRGVQSSGIILYHIPNDFAVSIEAGCNGVEAMIILAAAILAFPSSWKHKLIGLSLGFMAIQGLNLIRIISLFYIGQWNYAVFVWTHLYLWQALIMLDALVFWLVWMRMLPRKDGSKAFLFASGPDNIRGNLKSKHKHKHKHKAKAKKKEKRKK